MAIRACQEETSSFLRNREHMQMVKESLDEGYCDVSGRAGDLDLVGTSFNRKIFAQVLMNQYRCFRGIQNLCIAR